MQTRACLGVSQALSIFVLITLSILPCLDSANAQTSFAQNCQAAVAETKNRLEAVGNLEVTVDRRETDPPEHLQRRPYLYSFVIKGTAAPSVMNSTVMMTNLATSVIQSCDAVGEVSFGVAATGWSHPFGLFPNGRIEPFKCAEDLGMELGSRTGESPPWGYYFCSL